MKLIYQELELTKRNYDKNINIVTGLPFKQKDVIRMIEFYAASKYLAGDKDELGRLKPFYNIVNAMCDVENAAKDIDTKDISATSDDGQHYVESFLLTKDIYEWMKEVNFAKTLNDMRDTHTKYGSLLVKKCVEVDEDGDRNLEIDIPEWKNVITDQTDIANGTIIEIHYMTPSELFKMGEWDNQQEAIDNMKGENNEGVGKRIPVFEVRGEFPRSFYKDAIGKKPTKKDEKEYSYQLYYIAGTSETVIDIENVTFTDKLTLMYSEDDTERVYKYLARKRRAGRSFGVGVIEEGQEAQQWTNDAVMKQFRAMEYTTKVIGQTASKKLKGRNMMTEVDDGQILEHEDGKPITALNLLPAGGLNQYGMLVEQWYAQYERTTSAYAAQRGEAPPSGTPFRLQASILQQSSSVFSDLQEELGIFITEIISDWVMPYLAKKINAEHILAHEFTPDELKEIDRNFSLDEANNRSKDAILSGKIVTPEDYQQFQDAAKSAVGLTKGQRFLQIPKNYYKKFEATITINVTGEQRNKAVVLESLMNIMNTYASNPGIADDPVLMQIFMQIIEISGAGISPVSIMGAMAERAQQQAQAAPQNRVSESISYKDLPPDGQVQMAKQAGIEISTPQPVMPAPVQPAQAQKLSLSAKA